MTNQLQKKKLELFHISRYREDEEAIQEFIPRIPGNRMSGEDDSTPRICVSDNLAGCFLATSLPTYEMYTYQREPYHCPYEHMSHLDILLETNRAGQIYRIYHFDMDEEDVVTPSELHEKGWVPDALETKEHWITENRKPDRITYVFLLSVTRKNQEFVFQFTEEQSDLEDFGVMMRLDDLYFYTEARNESTFQVYSRERALEIKEELKVEWEVKKVEMEAEVNVRKQKAEHLWQTEFEVGEEDLPF